ncbi:hypothetical protein EV183_005562 [Coemansia sp. RSA 2336]|nr:hypothetical protein EV183_005562 [Coemansia sp. RSA 2336]
MQTRGSAAPTKTEPSTPPSQKQQAEAISTRLRSRAKSRSNMSEEDQPSTPTTARGRRSAVRKTSAEGAAPATPTRRSTRTAAIKANDLLHEGLVPASSRRRTPAKRASGQSSGEDAPSTPSRQPRASRTLGSRRVTRASSVESDDIDVTSPRRRKTRVAASSDDAEEDPFLSPPTTTRRRAARKGSDTPSTEPKQEPVKSKRTRKTSDVELPPLHPDLTSAARALAELSNSKAKQSLPPSRQSLENFQTAPESPEKKSQEITSAAEAQAAVAAAEDAVRDLEIGAAEDISDISDVEDPHFTTIMTAEAESAAMSAAESIAGSVAGSVKGDSDAEASEADSSDDEGPELITSKSGDSVVPDASAKKDSKASKRRRARQRKQAAAAAQAASELKPTLATAVEQLTQPPAMLPREIPRELQLTEKDIEPSNEPEAKPETEKLDASVLQAFETESSKRKRDDSDSKQKKKRAKKGKKKRNQNKLSRVVSGIRVVAAQAPSKMNMLDALAHSVPDSVHRFCREKRGGSRIKRTAPLAGIAKRNGQPAVNFFKS